MTLDLWDTLEGWEQKWEWHLWASKQWAIVRRKAYVLAGLDEG